MQNILKLVSHLQKSISSDTPSTPVAISIVLNNYNSFDCCPEQAVLSLLSLFTFSSTALGHFHMQVFVMGCPHPQEGYKVTQLTMWNHS